MKNVLDEYARPYNESNPVVCFDESPKQLISKLRASYIGVDKIKYEDNEYNRERAANQQWWIGLS